MPSAPEAIQNFVQPSYTARDPRIVAVVGENVPPVRFVATTQVDDHADAKVLRRFAAPCSRTRMSCNSMR
ncbi:MAG: hypothetical protein ACI9S9_004868 [Planctomycetota bacterium]|jgi:hypothetical protein